MSILVFHIGALGTMGAFIAATHLTGATRSRSVAHALARSEMERTIMEPYSSVVTSNTAETCSDDLPSIGSSFECTRAVAEDFVAGTKTITVTVNWLDPRGKRQVIQQQSVVTQ